MRDLAGPRRRSADFAGLLAAARDGRPWAIEALADEYLPRLAAFAGARGATDPDGVADVVLLSVLRRLDQLDFEVPAQFWAYLCRAARSRIIDEHRATKPVDLVADPGALDRSGSGGSGDDPGFDEAIAERAYVSDLLSPLTDEQREVLELRFLDDLSIERTASLTGRSEGAVKGLQRRAINAILAAVALLLIVAVIRGVGRGSDTEGDRGPADQVERSDGTGERDGDRQGDESGLAPDPSGPVAAQGDADRGAVTVEVGDPDGSSAEGAGGLGGPGGSDGVDRFTITVGTGRAASLDTSGRPGETSAHGVRIPCVVSHFATSDAVLFPDRPGASPARVVWGNTMVDAASGASATVLADRGDATCDAGIADRSAYWMPALFDGSDRAVLPESILVEYKSFGGPDFDRSTIRPIPVGLQLLADPSIDGADDRFRPAEVDGDTIAVRVAFPSCVRVGADGRPVLSSAGHRSHLAYPPGRDGRADGCPASHPYRIPELTYSLTYRVPDGADWYLSSGPGSTVRSKVPTGAAISAWDPEAATDLVTCVRDVLEGCWFRGLGDGGGTGDPDRRWTSPNGEVVYVGSMQLADDTDRTPFAGAIPPQPG